MKHLAALGIDTITLDVLSETSIAACVTKVPSLDILLNNAGGIYNTAVSDISIAEAKQLFDLNVWSYIAMTQAFLPHLMKSKGMIVNQTSVASVATLPFSSVYCASKAAAATFSDSLRLELAPFGIKVIDLKTGTVQSNLATSKKAVLPSDSIYGVARSRIERTLMGEHITVNGVAQSPWAEAVVGDLLKKSPASRVWRGAQARMMWFSTFLPHGAADGHLVQMTGLDVVAEMVGKGGE